MTAPLKEVEKECQGITHDGCVQKFMMIHYFLVIKAEKNEQKHRAGIEKFDKAELRKSQTVVKNPLPTKEEIEAEKQAN